MTKSAFTRTFVLILLLTAVMINNTAHADSAKLAEKILASNSIEGGLVVHVNCGDGELTAALRPSSAYLVQGLTRNPNDLAKARANIRGKGLYGPVSVDLLEGDTLPYIDNTVNLIVIDGEPAPPMPEIMRVLSPLGVAYTRKSLKWTKVTKPWPDNIDEWTHYLHDSTNNAVAHDTAIGPLRHLQWESGPTYARHHEFTSSVAAVVSAKGRIFSIMDMGSRASIHMPSKWKLTARDAFNGIVLWQRDIDSWFNHLWPLKDGPAQPPRRLVAVGDSVYVTLGFDAGVTRLDAATGKTIVTYDGTAFTEEILYSQGTLYMLKHDESMSPDDYYPKLMVCWDEKNRTMKKSENWLLKPDNRDIVAIDAETGKKLWTATHPVEPLSLAADSDGVYFHNWNQVVCLDRRTGDQKWLSKPVAKRDSMGYVYGPTLVSYKDVVLFADGRLKRKIFALSKTDGSQLWQAPHYAAGHAGSAEDLLVADGLVWCGKIAGGNTSGVVTGRDPKTGKIVREFTPDVNTYWFHHRCYRAKATDEYFLSSRTGIEFIDLREQTWQTHHWTRGGCTYGIMPCNGLIYAPPSPCACYLDSKLHGFNALAPASQRLLSKAITPRDRLHKGPAYGHKLNAKQTTTDQWPTYRHDSARSGATKSIIKLPLSEKWQVTLAGELTSPVIADNRVYVASPDTHTLYALNADNGQNLWDFTAGAKVDSPPTVYRGMVIFGSADGCVYCLRASDGQLVWRFRAAPQNMKLVSYGKLESVWPVHGSVLVENNTVYCIAGRSAFLDGGLRLIRLNAKTGIMFSENIIDQQANPQKDVQVLNMPVALPDILSTDGDRIYMRQQAFDLQGRQVQTIDPATEPFERATLQLGTGTHLFSPTGFLDDDAWHRSYWVYGRAFSSGCNWWYRAGRYAPAGRMLVFDDDRVYGFGREPGLFVWSPVLENHIFSSAKAAEPQAIERVKDWSKKSGRSAIFDRSFTRAALLGNHLAPKQFWSQKHPPIHARAMLLAGDTLFVAGPPDVLDEDEAFEQPFDPQTKKKIAAQDAAYQGQSGAVLMAVSSTDGKIYITTKDAKITCLQTGDSITKNN